MLHNIVLAGELEINSGQYYFESTLFGHKAFVIVFTHGHDFYLIVIHGLIRNKSNFEVNIIPLLCPWNLSHFFVSMKSTFLHNQSRYVQLQIEVIFFDVFFCCVAIIILLLCIALKRNCRMEFFSIKRILFA